MYKVDKGDKIYIYIWEIREIREIRGDKGDKVDKIYNVKACSGLYQYISLYYRCAGAIEGVFITLDLVTCL